MAKSVSIKKALHLSLNEIVALRFNTLTNRITMIGYSASTEQIEYIIGSIFNRIRRVEDSSKTKRRVRYSFISTPEKFFNGLTVLKERIHVEDVKSFGRLIR